MKLKKNNMLKAAVAFVVAVVLIVPGSAVAVFEIQDDDGIIIGSQTVGLCIKDEGVFNGYILFAPRQSTITYLINNDGEVVHRWVSDYMGREAVYLLENGNLLRGCIHGPNPYFWSGGVSGYVEEFDWDGNIIWEFEYSNDQHCLHHDIEPLPNGNVLMIAWELKTTAEAVAAGRDLDLPMERLWVSHIIEVEPTGSSGGNIVWEWHVWDHLIQDYDPAKENYGVVEDHPELVDINFGNMLDWDHMNSVDYNEEFDQILLSVRHFSEIWVIDHSTTTEEAAGHTGGNRGNGGDLLYRWGNPRAYRAGDADDQKLFMQHDARWIEHGCPGEGNILVFNNGLMRPDGRYSSVDEFASPVDINGDYFLVPDSAYEPEETLWAYTDENPTDFFAAILSGAQRLPSGNTLICNGPSGYFFEVTPEKETVWEYNNPFPNPSFHGVFKIQYYDNIAPRKPSTPNGPSSGITGVEYTYSSSTTDFDGDDIYYLFDWGDGTTSGWLGPYASGDSVEANHSWTHNGSYSIMVKAKDVNDAESDWSNLTTYIGDAPVIEVGVITGGLFKVNVVIKNTGSVDVLCVNWSIVLDGGLIRLGKETIGVIPSIPVGEEVIVGSDLIVGFGIPTVTVSAEIPGVNLDLKEQNALVLFFFIKMVNI